MTGGIPSEEAYRRIFPPCTAQALCSNIVGSHWTLSLSISSCESFCSWSNHVFPASNWRQSHIMTFIHYSCFHWLEMKQVPNGRCYAPLSKEWRLLDLPRLHLRRHGKCCVMWQSMTDISATTPILLAPVTVNRLHRVPGQEQQALLHPPLIGPPWCKQARRHFRHLQPLQ